jgi:hypothetical protein
MRGRTGTALTVVDRGPSVTPTAGLDVRLDDGLAGERGVLGTFDGRLPAGRKAARRSGARMLVRSPRDLSGFFESALNPCR